MSLYRVFDLMVAKKKLVGGLLAVVMVFCFGVVPSKAVAATDAEILAMIQNIVRVIEAIRNQINTQTVGVPINLGSVEDKFTQPVTLGSANSSVLLLHEILGTDKNIYSGSNTSNTFSSETTESLIRFQTKFHLPITGTFTPETKYTLNVALANVPFGNLVTDYLIKAEVEDAINQATDSYLLGNFVSNGKVALRPFPVFSTTVKSSDTATLQRIMKTDLELYQSGITGLMDTSTIQGVIKLRAKYGIPYIFATSSQGIIMTDLIDSKTTILINKILEVNNSSAITETLLKSSAASPTTLVPNSSRTILSVMAVRDYIKRDTTVTVLYTGRIQETFKTNVFLPNQTLIAEIASKINRSVADFEEKIAYSELFAKEYKHVAVTFKPQKKEEVDLLATYLDDTTKLFQTTRADEREIIDTYFDGNDEQFYTARDGYIEQARIGEVSNDLYKFIADMLSVPISEIRSKVSIKTDEEAGAPVDNGG